MFAPCYANQNTVSGWLNRNAQKSVELLVFQQRSLPTTLYLVLNGMLHACSMHRGPSRENRRAGLEKPMKQLDGMGVRRKASELDVRPGRGAWKDRMDRL